MKWRRGAITQHRRAENPGSEPRAGESAPDAPLPAGPNPL